MSKTAELHKEGAPKILKIHVVTVSTSKYHGEGGEDVSGDLIEELLKAGGHKIAGRTLIPDERERIGEVFKRLLEADVDAIISTGGTGVSKTDVTIEAVHPLLDKDVPGFGETLRRLSYDEIGSPALLTRALGGVASGKAVFCLPGSPNAVILAMEKLILPEISHIVKHARELCKRILRLEEA